MTEPTELIREARKIEQSPNWSTCNPMCPRGEHEHARPLMSRLADALEAAIAERDEARRDMDARWEHSDHLAAKYYQRMRAAERARAAAEDAAEARVRDIRDITALSRRAVADAWDQGALWCAVETAAIPHESVDFLAPGDNPYRKETT